MSNVQRFYTAINTVGCVMFQNIKLQCQLEPDAIQVRASLIWDDALFAHSHAVGYDQVCSIQDMGGFTQSVIMEVVDGLVACVLKDVRGVAQ